MDNNKSKCHHLASSLAKQASPDQRVLRASAAKDLQNILLTGLGIGAGARGLYGLYNLAQRSGRGPEQPRTPGPLVLDYPIPTREEEDELRPKLAADDESFWDSQSKTGIPWYLPGGLAAGAGGVYGGWKLMDMILDRRRNQEQEDDLEQARAEFRAALTGGGPKLASDGGNTLGHDLDRLYDMLQEKQAEFEKTSSSAVGDIWGKIKGGYGVYSGLTSLAAGLWMYNRAKKMQRRTLLEKAKKERERQRFERRPPAIEALPTPA